MNDSKWFMLILAIIVVMFGCMAFFFMGKFTPNNAIVNSGNEVTVATMMNGYQVVSLNALSTGLYDHRVIEVKAGVPVRLTFTADQYAGCGRQLIIPDFGVQTIAQPGQSQTVEFTPTTPGQYPYRCGMNMFRGTLIVK